MIYHKTFPNALYGHLVPPEDSSTYEENIFVVADGITRDPLGDPDFSQVSLEERMRTYPNPSGARLAADLFLTSFMSFVKDKSASEQTLREAFISGNQAIAALNTQQNPHSDYLVNDYWACVASAGIIQDMTLYFALITDCGVAVFHKNGELAFQSPNSMPQFQEYLATQAFDFRKPEGRVFIRKECRNKPERQGGNPCTTYGALTGERDAEAFIKTGTIPLQAGDTVLFYSDGFEDAVRHPELFACINQETESLIDQKLVPFTLNLAKQDYSLYGHERTFIMTRV